MMKGKKFIASEEFIVTVILFLGILFLTIYVWRWPPRPKMVPLAVCWLVLALLAVQMVNLGLRGKKSEKAGQKIPWRVLAGFGSLGVTIPIIYFAGVAPGVGVLGAALCALFGERRWWIILLVGIGCWLLMYYLFGVLFAIPMKLN